MTGGKTWWMAAALGLAAASARADPIVLTPAASIEIVAPSAGGLRREVSENVALGPGGETRVFYEFAIQALRSTRSPIVFSIFQRLDEFSECVAEHFDVDHATFQVEPAGHQAHEDLGPAHA